GDGPGLHGEPGQLPGDAQLPRRPAARGPRVPRAHGPPRPGAAARPGRQHLPEAARRVREPGRVPRRQAAGGGAAAAGPRAGPRAPPGRRRSDPRPGPRHRRAGVVRPRTAPGARPGLLHRGGGRPLRARPRLEAVGEMNRHSLLTKTLLLMLGVFGATTLTMAGFSAWFLNRHLTEEYQSQGTAIA